MNRPEYKMRNIKGTELNIENEKQEDYRGVGRNERRVKNNRQGKAEKQYSNN